MRASLHVLLSTYRFLLVHGHYELLRESAPLTTADTASMFADHWVSDVSISNRTASSHKPPVHPNETSLLLEASC